MLNTPKTPSWSRSSLLRVFVVVLLLGLSAASTHAQSYAMTNLWSVAPSTAANPSPTHPFIDTNHLVRDMSYNPVSGNVLVPSRAGSNAVHVLSGATGAKIGHLPYDTNVVWGGTFHVNTIGIADDGVIYVANLTTDSTNTTAATGPFRLYRWGNESAQPELSYSGDPTGANTNGASPRRVGDSMAVRGAGAQTQILLGSFNQNVYLLTTTDGTNFTARKITTDMAASDSRWGIAWGAGNTFWVKQGPNLPGNLKQLSLDLVNNTATVVGNYSALAGVTGGPIALDLTRNLIAIVDTSGHRLRLYDISDPLEPLLQDSIKNFPGTNSNGNFTGAAVLRDGKLFALESNNGILAYSLHEVTLAPSIVTAPTSVSVWDGAPGWTFNVTPTGTRPFTYQWLFNGSPIAGATTRSFSITNVTAANHGAYSAVVSNDAGSATSSAAQLTVLPTSASSKVESLWDVAPDTRPYLTSGYREYGVAINPVNNNVIVVTRPNPTNMIAVLDGATGTHQHYIDYTGLPLNGGTPMNKVDIADDGAIYIVNFTSTPSTIPFTILGIGSDVENTSDKWLAYAGNPGPLLPATENAWGRTIAVRGGGLNTEILIGNASTTGKTVAIFRPNEFYEFSPMLVNVADAPAGFSRLGIAWGPGNNTFWAKSVGSLYLVEFDLNAGTGFIRKTYPTTGLRSVTDSVTGLSYNPTTQLLSGLRNGVAVRPVSVPVYDVSDVEAGPVEVDTELFGTFNADIEYQGQTDMTATRLVALGVNNGLKMLQVNGGTANPPFILTHPVGGTHYVSMNTTLDVIADSNAALTYQWYQNGNPVPDATASTLTLSNIQTNNAGVYFVRVSNGAGTRDSLSAVINVIEPFNTSVSTNIWSLAPGSRPYLNTTYKEYGMSFNPANSNLLITTTEGGPQVAVLNALTGEHKHSLDVSPVSGGTKVLHKIDVAADGVVYAGNLTTAAGGNAFKLYRWSNDEVTTIPTVAFQGDPGASAHANGGYGYTLDARGAGVNTEILLSMSSSNVVSVLKTANGIDFTSNPIKVAGAPNGFARLGASFGDGNTFWAKTANGLLHLVQYDLAAGTGAVLKAYATNQVPALVTAVDYQSSRKFLAGFAHETPKNVQIYDVADLEAGPQLLDQELFDTTNPSIEANGELDFGGNYLFALDQNNGVRAYLLQDVPGSLQIIGIAAANGTVTIEWQAVSGTTYRVYAVDDLSGTWQPIGSPVLASGSTATFMDTPSAGVTQRFYRVVAE